MKLDGKCLIELIGPCRNKVQEYRSARMPRLHTSMQFHLTPIVMINSLSRRDLLFQNFCRSTPTPQGQRTRRFLSCAIGGSGEVGIGEHSSFSSYPLRTWLPSVYRGHDMDQTVSRRSEPSSRTALMGKHANPRNI
ncbi:hypothetical protein BVRB_032100, partial [Beta vulgaris subsp. vulgaris]